MPNIIVCYKWVLDERDIFVKPNSLELDTSKAKGKISDYDRNAIEAGLRIVEQHGGKLFSLTYGSSQVKASLKDVLSRGPEAAYWIGHNSADTADAMVTARVLAAAIKGLGEFDIIICGEGSADQYSQQVGPRLADLLNIPVASYVQDMEMQDGKLLASRNLGNSIEKLEVRLPAIITVLPEINEPRLPTLKQVLAAGKKPMNELKMEDLGIAAEKLQPKTRIKQVKAATNDRKNILIKKDTMLESVSELIDYLKKDNVLQ